MEKKSDSDAEHSLWSQDTELISVPSEENNLSLEIGSAVLPLEPDDSDQSGRNVPSTTACSTPHESKLALSAKRRFESSSEDLSPRRKKTKGSLSPVRRPALLFSPSNGTELTNGSDSEITSGGMNTNLHNMKEPKVIYAEANSSDLSAEQSSNQKSDVQASTFLKAMSPPSRYLEKTKSFKQKDHDREPGPKESKIKHFTEDFVCSISYTIDELKKDIVSVYIKEVIRPLYDSKNASNKLSLSSGTLADISGSDGGNSGHSIEKFALPPKLSITSTSSLSSVSSSSSSLPSTANKLQQSLNKFLVPQVSEFKKQVDYRCKGNVCQCFCSKFVSCLLKQPLSSRCITPEILSSSSENLKTDSQEFIDGQEIKLLPKKHKSDVPVISEEVIDESKFPCNSSRSSIYVPSCTNLPVFAKWPGNSWFYPGIIENADEDTWHTCSHLEVKFCDGTMKNTRTTNLFPAYLLPSRTEVTYEKEGNSETIIITSVNRLPNNELLLVSESGDSIPFQKICFSTAHYKEFLKENSSVLTPRKTPKFSISIANVQQGKRARKVVRSGSSCNSESKPKLSSSKKTPASRTRITKRGRVTSDSSSTDLVKSEKKKIRGSSQKKPNTETKMKEMRTPHTEVETEKKEVVRKLCLEEETPGCSYKLIKDIPKIESSEQSLSTDTESSGDHKIVVDEISCPTLDEELILDISRRSFRNKSSLKKTTSYVPKNQEKINELGPLPEIECFSTYNFVLTHSKPKERPIQKLAVEESFSEEGTDFEDYYETKVPFDYLWLKEQILSGGGKVYKSLLDVDKQDHRNTVVIADNIFETPNYLMAVSLGIPIYRHDLIVNCCIQRKHLKEMLSHAMKMPNGRSLDTGEWVETSTRCSLKGYCCLLSLNVNNSTLQFWKKLLLNAGAVVIDGDEIKIISEQQSHISFIIGDAALPEEISTLANCYNIPIVSTAWLSQSIIQGKPRSYNAHPEYNVYYIPS